MTHSYPGQRGNLLAGLHTATITVSTNLQWQWPPPQSKALKHQHGFLLPGITLSCDRIYPLSVAERKAMKEYTQEALQQGYIHHSMSTTAARFFFWPKKGTASHPVLTIGAVRREVFCQVPISPSIYQSPQPWKVCKGFLKNKFNIVP